MRLSIREAAALTHRNARTLRAQLTRGELQGRKVDGRWTIDPHDLPLTESQRTAIQARAEEIRDAAERALPSRQARHSGDRRRSALDLEPLRAGRAIYRELATSPACAALSGVADTRAALRAALEELTRATYDYDLGSKIATFRSARQHLSSAIASLLITEDASADDARTVLVTRLESEVLVPLGGILRWAEKLLEKRRA